MNFICILSLVLFIVGVHTGIRVNLTETVFVPYALCVAGAIVGLPAAIVYWRLVNPARARAVAWYVILATLVTVIFNVPRLDPLAARGFLQFIYSIGLASVLYIVVLALDGRVVQRVAFIAIIIICVLASLEAIGTVREAMDSIKDAVGLAPYSNIERDTLVHGGLRSTAFASEPSHAATTIFWLTALMFWGGALSWVQKTVWLACIVLAIYFIRSPFLLLAVGVFVAGAELLEGRQRRETKIGRRVVIVSGVFVACFTTYIVLSYRFEDILHSDGSMQMRWTGPLLVWKYFVSTHPLSGVGVIGGLRPLVNTISEVYEELGTGILSTDIALEHSVTNCLIVHFIYFGIPAGLAAMGLLIRVAWINGRAVWNGVLIAELFILAMMMGGYNTVVPWACAAALVAAAVRTVDFSRVRAASPAQGWPGSRIA